jgi:phage shock protein PspC (stress-responsive transcriptional regulator)/predicted membrane protein
MLRMHGAGRPHAVHTVRIVRTSFEEQPVDTTQIPPPPAGPDTAGERPPLRRPQEGRILAGVAAGLADHLGWDVSLVRLLFVVVTLITQGLGLLVYLAAALLIPAAEPGAPRPAPVSRSPGELGGRPPSFWLGVGLLAIGAWWLFAVTPMRFGLLPGVSMGSIAAPLLLIAFGLALWVTGDRSPATPSAPSTPASVAPSATARLTSDRPATTTSPATTPATSQETTMDTITDPTRQDPSSTPPAPPVPPTAVGDDWTPPPAPERSRSILGRATVGLMLVTVGILWSLRLADVLAISVGQLLAAALLAVGIGLLVGAVIGRSRGLIWLGVVLLPLVLVAQIPEASWVRAVPVVSADSSAAGELRLTPEEFDDLEARYEIGAGSIRLDLTELPFDGESVDLEVSVGAGEIRIIVPDDVTVTATGSVGIGQIQLEERSAGGLGIGDLEVELDPDDPVGSIDLELNAGLGDIRMDTAPAATTSRN